MCGRVRASVKSLHEAEILSIPVGVETPECSRCQDHGTSVKEEPYVECSLCKRERFWVLYITRPAKPSGEQKTPSRDHDAFFGASG